VELIGIMGSMAPRNPALVLLPGFMQPADAWAPVAERLPERYPSLLLRHGEHSYEGRLGEIAAAGRGAVLCGYSLGGRLALHAALRDPAAYAGLVTLGVSAGIEAPAQREERRLGDEKLAGWMETQPIDAIVSVWERQPLFADQSDALVEAQRPGRLAQLPQDLALTLRSAGQGALEPVWDRLPGLSLPVLAMAGDRDERYTEAARRIASSVPDGRAEVVENAGHAAHLQQPEAVALLLTDFLDQHLGQRVV
jgi:2-succinyl-6-hydroxy-2,4-cyclohexadiene-1-carboxylate synthase